MYFYINTAVIHLLSVDFQGSKIEKSLISLFYKRALSKPSLDNSVTECAVEGFEIVHSTNFLANDFHKM